MKDFEHLIFFDLKNFIMFKLSKYMKNKNYLSEAEETLSLIKFFQGNINIL